MGLSRARGRIFALGCASVLAVGLLGPLPAMAQAPRAERPTYSLGEKWIRSDGVFELIRIEKDEYVFAAEGGREIYLTKDLVVAKIVTRGAVEWEIDPPPKIRWPLEVGAWGRQQLGRPELRLPGGGQGATAMVTWQVEALETVRVPAGEFLAWRITQRLQVGFAGGVEVGTVTLWYAAEARQVIKAAGVLQGRQPIAFRPFEVVGLERSDPRHFQLVVHGVMDQMRVSSERMTLAGNVFASRGVTLLSVTVNGKEVSTEEDKQGKRQEIALNVPLKLEGGRNVVLITATQAGGETRQEARTIYYDGAVAAAPPPSQAPPPIAVTPPPPAPGKIAAGAASAPPPSSTPPAAVAPSAPAPFVVALSSPADQARLEQDTIGVAGLVSGGKGVRRIVVTLNGLEVSRQDEQAPRPAAGISAAVTLREGQNTVVATAVDADGYTQQAVRTVYYEKPNPLTVSIRYPAEGAKLSQENSVVAGLATSSKGVAKVTVSLNGAEVHQQAERAPQKAMPLSVPVTLREGQNVIVVSAAEPDGTVRQEVRTVDFQRPPAAAAPAASPAPPKPDYDRWAVVIGVGQYDSGDIPRLRYSVGDAEAIYQVLTGPGGFKKEHVLLLTDRTERKPTLRNIRWALGTFLSRSARKDDTVLIYFAGHGAPETDPRGIERDGLAKYLITSDTDPDDLYSSALPMDELQTIFGRIEAERVVALLDTCYSGAAGGRTFAAKRTRGGYVDELFLERLTRSKGRAIITASRPSEVSLELPDLGHGIFTYYLVQGLKGAADGNKDGIVTVQELYEYVEQQVSAKSRAVGANQHPVMKGEMEGALPLVKVR